MVKFFDTRRKVSLRRVTEIESLIGLTFPDEYKAHLLKYNGGQCEPNIFSFIENGRRTESDIQQFLAIDGDREEDDDDLLAAVEDYKIDEKRMPAHMLPIAYDSGGNCVCLSCDGFDRGKIYFWDHEREHEFDPTDDSDYSNLPLIANSFAKFLDGLIDENELLSLHQ